MLGPSPADGSAMYSRPNGQGPMLVPISEGDVVSPSPACWMQGLFQALDEVFGGMKREGSRGIVLVRYGRQDS